MTSISRQMWEAVERYHQLCYWAPEVREEGTRAGLKGFWMNYFATRVAPLGAVSPETVQSLFFYYSPDRSHRAIPAAWSFATPNEVLAARFRGMDQALRRELGSLFDSQEVFIAVELAQQAIAATSGTGRTLYSGWNSLPWPDEPHLALWQACTVLREHRSGSHLLALATEELDGPQSVITQVAVNEAPVDWIQHEAGWSDAAVEEAKKLMRARGWLDDADQATAQCYEGRRRVEALTDSFYGRHWEQLGADKCTELSEVMNALNQHLPKDDQLDWQEIYVTDHEST
mgnify:FL=1